MANTYVRKFEKPLKQVEQTIQDTSVFIPGMRIEPFTPYLRTNNFIQNTLSRGLLYSPTTRGMVKIRGDEEGRQEVYLGMPGSLENRINYYGVVRDVPNGATETFTTSDRLSGNLTIPYTVPDGKKLFVNHAITTGTSPGEIRFQYYTGSAWVNAEVAFFDSYDEIDIFWLVSTPYSAGTQVRVSVVNNGGTGDFTLDLTGWLEKESVD